MNSARSLSRQPAVRGLAVVVGFLVAVEFASGILQGYYTPILTDIARHLGIDDADLNWFEAAQLLVSALCVPLLTRLGDLIGHKKILLLSTAVTAIGSWMLAFAPSFSTFLIGWALQGAYVVWLPVEVAIIYRRTRGQADQNRITRKAAAILVGALELSVIVGALTAGQLVESLSMTTLLALPAAVVTVVLVGIWWGVEDTPGEASGGLDWGGYGLIALVIGAVMGGLLVIRGQGLLSPLGWLLVVAGLGAVVLFVRYERAHPDPLISIPVFSARGQWPIQLTAFLFGMSVLGAQIPLSTFARTDPDLVGYGLGATAAFVSTLIGVYVIAMAVGAFSLPLTTGIFGPRGALVAAAVLVAIGYALWIPFHGSTAQALTNMLIAGLGSGALVAALPASAAAAAPAEHTGIATGMTNGVKTIGGAIASAVFAIALSGSATGGEADLDAMIDSGAGHAPLSGYLTVWAVCAIASLVAAVVLAIFRPDPDPHPGSAQAQVESGPRPQW